eukprot:767628-Hanusia_phi.AAC.2
MFGNLKLQHRLQINKIVDILRLRSLSGWRTDRQVGRQADRQADRPAAKFLFPLLCTGHAHQGVTRLPTPKEIGCVPEQPIRIVLQIIDNQENGM